MGHCIGHIDLDYEKGRLAQTEAYFVSEVEEIMCHEGNDEGGRYSTRTTWHEDKVYDTWEEARDAVDGMHGFYDCHAVLYRDADLSSIGDTPSYRKLKERVDEAGKHARRLEAESDVHRRRADSITCPKCRSRIMLAYYRGEHDCPVCGMDMRSESVRRRVANAWGKYRELKARLHDEYIGLAKKLSGNAPLKWCVEYDFHC